MADDKSKRGGADRGRVSASEQYEVRYFARKHRLTMDQARDIIQKAGPSRDAANAAAENLKKR
jgi:hypothetical protein